MDDIKQKRLDILKGAEPYFEKFEFLDSEEAKCIVDHRKTLAEKYLLLSRIKEGATVSDERFAEGAILDWQCAEKAWMIMFS